MTPARRSISRQKPVTVSSMISATGLIRWTSVADSPAPTIARSMRPFSNASMNGPAYGFPSSGVSPRCTDSASSVRTTRMVTSGCAWAMLRVMSVSAIACFHRLWAGLSAELMNRVPINTPSAPSAKAAAMPRPSTIPRSSATTRPISAAVRRLSAGWSLGLSFLRNQRR